MLDNLKSIVATVAPALATALGGPLAGTAVSALSKSLLGREDATEDELVEALSSPDSLIKLKEANYKFLTDMRQAGITEKKLEQMSVKNAQDRELGMAKAGKRDYMVPFLAIAITASYVSIILCCIFYPIKPEARTLVDILIGNLSGGWMAVVAYYFGSSAGSRQKDKAIEGINKG